MRAESTLRFLPLSDGKQPLYMWATIPFLKVISDPLVAARTLSGLIGLITVVGVGVGYYLLFRSLRGSLITSLVWSVLPYSVFFERMALADAMLTCFVIWGFNLAIITFSHLRLDSALLSGFAFGFAWLTKSPAMFGLAMIPTTLLLKSNSSRSLMIRLAKASLLYVVIVILAVGLYNILRLGPEFNMISIRNMDYIHPLSEVLKHPLDPLVPHLKDAVDFYYHLFTPLGVLLVIWGIFDARSHHWRQRLLLLIWLIVPVIGQAFIAKTFTARYLFFTVPFAVILAAHSLDHLGERTKRHFLSFVSTTALVILCLSSSLKIVYSPISATLPRIERSGYLEEWTAGFGLKEIADDIKSKSSTGRQVVVGSEGFFGTPFSALEMYLNGVSNVRVVGVGVAIGSVPNQLSSALKDNAVYLVVNSSRFQIENPAEVGLKLIKSYPKAIRPDSTREETLYFEVEQVK